MSNRQTVLQAAFEIAHFDADFDMDVVYRLQNSMHSSVDILAVYGLSRVHAWLWPILKELSLGEEVQIGPFLVVGAEREVAAGRELSKQSYHVHSEGKRWKIAWRDVEGQHSTFGVGVDPEAFFSVAYCEFGDVLGKPVKGGVSGRGSEIRQLFDFLVLAGEAMPSSVREVGSEALARAWEFEEIQNMVEFDGRLGATFGAELHDLAEQRASKMLCDIAGQNAVELVRGLKQHGLIYGKAFLRSKNSTVFALEESSPSISAFYSERFPGGEGDRHLSWCSLGVDGAVTGYHVYMLPPEKRVSDAIAEFAQGFIKPSSSHDYTSGQTSFADTIMGYTHLAAATIFLHHDTYLVTRSSVNDWERSEHFDDLDDHVACTPLR
jgi:hypothetical protein